MAAKVARPVEIFFPAEEKSRAWHKLKMYVEMLQLRTLVANHLLCSSNDQDLLIAQIAI